MSRKGVEFTLEFKGITEEDINNKPEITKEIQNLIDNTDFPITEVGFYENTNNFVIQGKIVSFTKKEVNAIYTVFKGKLKNIFKSYGLKPVPSDNLLMYFTTLY